MIGLAVLFSEKLFRDVNHTRQAGRWNFLVEEHRLAARFVGYATAQF
jgi:hypothetical protein